MEYAWWAGGVGVIWDDDDGYMTHNLFKVLGGMSVKFPIQYRSEYVDESDYTELNA